MNPNYLNKVNLMIESLGYRDSENYIEFDKNNSNEIFDFHWNKVLSIIQPSAIYTLNGSPFILFFIGKKQEKIDFKSIWNAQIPFVFLITEDTVYVYSGMELEMQNNALKELEKGSISDPKSIKLSYWNLNNERFLNEYKRELSTNQLNYSLLNNIESLTKKLKNKYHVPFATKLVLRIIFIRFLIDREVNLGYKNFSTNIENSQKEFLKILQRKEELYDLFKYLKEKFNGNLFELGDEISSETLTEDVFTMLMEFISGELALENGQTSLFPMYDFNIISVELISNIYEILLGNEGQQKNKSFYTPTYLVEYILSKTVDENIKTNKSNTILDPSCGSGIFLVKAYRKIIENKLKTVKKSQIDKILINELKENIFGVDLSAEAIDVSLFSLYLTILDYKDPKDLGNFKLPNLLNSNLFVSDFFDVELKENLGSKKFDYVLGNPPWGGVTGQTTELSKKFIFELDDYVHEDSICSLVLPSKLLYNHKESYKKIREFLLRNNCLIEVMDLSPVRKEIFKNAIAPAVIITYRKSTKSLENTLKNKFTHISLKPNLYFELFELLVIEKNDVKYVEQNLLNKNDWAWKVLLYGSSWDLDICFNLRNNYPSIRYMINQINKERNENEAIIYGTGIQLGNKEDVPLVYKGRPLVDSKLAIDSFKVDLSHSKPFNTDKVHRSRNARLFEGPFSLVKKGINTRDFRMKAAYSNKDFLFQETIRAIKGANKDQVFLKSITGLLNSSLAAYVNVLLHSSIGIEREQVFLEEILEFPYFDDRQNEKEISKVVDQIQDISNSIIEYEYKKSELFDQIDQLVLEAFNLKNNPFIDYMLNIQIPMISKEKNQLGNFKVNKEQLECYAKEFQSYFVKLYGAHGFGIEIIFYIDISNQYVAFELNIRENSKEHFIKFCSGNPFDKAILSKFSVQKYTDSFYAIKDVIVFKESSFYILKKDLFKNWHPAIAQKDLAEVIDVILKDGE